MTHVGIIIQDHYCNGFRNTKEDLSGSIIEAEGRDWIVLRTSEGNPIVIDFSKHLIKKEDLIASWSIAKQKTA
ncbi:hypothetical protein IFO69_10325 [Echinicola sp. CAU 1574]|uniref:Uncharacterized protein n=1 Tax=Echinicola arenosa TaxID=2774144 RepID=A0ABR9AML5_9BACT|nr:hypothetical protein [Echinicola arenosa]MBD8489140.1 hypothetical protein [Echinicola arenosa]